MIKLFKDPFFDVLNEFTYSNHELAGPKSKVIKTDEGYRILFAVPGLTKDDLKMSSKEGVLKISFEKDEENKDTHFVTNFTKSYNIPDDVNDKDITGKVENGLLEIILPISKKKNLERLISLN